MVSKQLPPATSLANMRRRLEAVRREVEARLAARDPAAPWLGKVHAHIGFILRTLAEIEAGGPGEV